MPRVKYVNKEGKQLPGVTSIIANLGWSTEPLLFWANRIGREQGLSHRDKSLYEADTGSLVHAYIERRIWEMIDGNKSKKK